MSTDVAVKKKRSFFQRYGLFQAFVVTFAAGVGVGLGLADVVTPATRFDSTNSKDPTSVSHGIASNRSARRDEGYGEDETVVEVPSDAEARAMVAFRRAEASSETEIRGAFASILATQQATGFTFWLFVAWRGVLLSVLAAPILLSSPLLLLGAEALWWRLLKRTLESAGPCWIKLGQWAATRPDLFPDGLCLQLAELQDACAFHSLEDTRRMLVSAFGSDRSDSVFAELPDEPIASGVIAQVYDARLADGRRVAVKVAHPNVGLLVAADLYFLRLLATMLTWTPGLTAFANPSLSLAQFARAMWAQVDLRAEAAHLARFQRNFASDPNICFPTVIDELSSVSVLVESFEEGVPLKYFLASSTLSTANPQKAESSTKTTPAVPTDAHLFSSSNLASSTSSSTSVSSCSRQQQSKSSLFRYAHVSSAVQKRIANLGLDAYLRMVLVHNFIHADLHPGNILVHVPPERPVEDLLPEEVSLVFLDAGLVNELEPLDMRNIVFLFRDIIGGEGRRAAREMIDSSRRVKPMSALEQEEFLSKMASQLNVVKRQPLTRIRVGNVLGSMARLCRDYGVMLEPSYATLMVSTAVLEGIGRQLDPEINFVGAAAPVLARREIAIRRKHVRSISEYFYSYFQFIKGYFGF